jgi:protein associated with RNAse G/E
LDEDEFAAHQVRFGYPRELIDGARSATAAIERMLARRTEPFDRAAERWLELADRVLGADRLVPRS